MWGKVAEAGWEGVSYSSFQKFQHCANSCTLTGR